VGNISVQVFSRTQQRLIESAALGFEDKRALGVLLCFYTGIRLGELCALKWSDIDVEAGVMSIVRTVSRTKVFSMREQNGAAYRYARAEIIGKILCPHFYSRCRATSGRFRQGLDYVLSGSDVRWIPGRIRSVQKAPKSAGIKHVKFHTIRHTFATRALELGVDIKTLSEILGHSKWQYPQRLRTLAHGAEENGDGQTQRDAYVPNGVASFAVAAPS
jgi:integrase